ncbi:MAG: VWA domain-containing protein [Mediterranea sp.]|jgi:hypothetical protein|nr:VWA domain-containing protein [Mediterranea sp.]
MNEDIKQKLVRWRLIVGQAGVDNRAGDVELTSQQSIMDAALAAIYDDTTSTDGKQGGASKQGGLGNSSPRLAKWLVDVRTFFPPDVVSVIQNDAIERKGFTKLLLEPETLKNITPDIHMVGTLLALKGQIPEKSKFLARQMIRTVVDDIIKRLGQELRRAVTGAINRRNHSPLSNVSAIDWKRTIADNLRHYNPDTRCIIPQKFWFFERSRKQKQWSVILDIDQSGSMMDSIIYSSVMGSILASLPTLDTHVVAFDTQVVDLTDLCRHDPVDMLFGLQLGGGTDINKSVKYCRTLITDPRKTIFILISDLYEGGVEAGLLRRLQEMRDAGVKVITLLALSDEGNPSYDTDLAKKIAKLGIPCFGCTPDRLPELIEAALKERDLMRFGKSF